MSSEETKLRRVEESIRVFVRVADPKCRQIVPMRYFNLTLNEAEVEAYTADYLEQSSPTADVARILLRMVALTARLTTEMQELRRSSHSSKVWKLHADSLVILIEMATRLAEVAGRSPSVNGNISLAREAETTASGSPLAASLEKLRQRAAEAAKLIRET